jgi:hypothetical protein
MITRRREWHQLTGACALDALEPAEQAAFEHHVARCGTCAAEVRGLRETAARLAETTAARPPDRLREQVLAASRRTRQLPPLTIRPRPARSRIPWPRLSVAVAAVSLAAAITLGFIQISTWQQLGAARHGDQEIAAILSAPDARVIIAQSRTGGTVTIIASRTEGAAIITSAGLPSLPPGRTYEAWVVAPAGPRPAGFLAPGHLGRTAPIMTSIGARDSIGLTIEPSGGTPRPTTPLLIAVALPG